MLSDALKGTRHFVNELKLDIDVDKLVTRLDGFSDSDWTGSQSSGALFVDGAAIRFFSRRQFLRATSSGMAEFCVGFETSVEMFLARDVLMFFRCREEASFHMEGSTNVVVTTGGQSENTHTQDSEIEGQLC